MHLAHERDHENVFGSIAQLLLDAADVDARRAVIQRARYAALRLVDGGDSGA